ncbi:MAG: threonine-phosphate decarboxylase [Deltaproteobacteria bacterium]|nr:threonine-phosphate decarboxylase [Deltaproteobacteria bacterium]MBW2137388.1 threonine-phosphate decarboxylase [Deltaproteobacteria bacterium]
MNYRGKGYRHGGSPAADMIRLGLDPGPVLDFSVNINPRGAPAPVRERWSEFYELIGNYPAIEGDGVTRFYEERFGIPRTRCLPGNGSTELIYMIPRVLGVEHAVVVTPSYHDYERATLLAGARVTRLRLSPEEDFAPLPVAVLSRALEEADAIWLGRPNNPTGTLAPKRDMVELAERHPDKWVILDEAFVQFLEEWQEESLLLEPPMKNVLVVHSLTKFYALAGLRLGAVVGHEQTISLLKQAKEPWTVNAVADRVATLIIGARDYDEESRRVIAQERDRVYTKLKEGPGYRPCNPTANFLLCRWEAGQDLDDLLRHLLVNGLYARDCRNFPGLEEGFFRIGVRRRAENDRLLEVLASAPGA